jgi:hypothetical protein
MELKHHRALGFCFSMIAETRYPLFWNMLRDLAAARTPDLWIDGTRMPLAWDEPMVAVGRR